MRGVDCRGLLCALTVFIAVCAAASAAQCPGCKAEMQEGWKFCPFCAAKIQPPQPAVCPKCATRVEPGWKACPICGALLQEAPAPPAPAQAPALKDAKVLWDFKKESDLSAWKCLDGATASIIHEHVTSGANGVKIDFPASPEGAPGFKFEKGTVNMSGYATLEADIYNSGTQPLSLSVKLKSNEHARQTTTEVELPPSSAKALQIPLDSIARRVDLNDIMYLNFFFWQPPQGGTIYINSIRLVK
ncbi:MAG: zinc ribbon domain-containing protein [Candidatus Aureabacteria bacterium]|nr:zinc ribbon domain-containing protein [Candidatus Auribacterota bacterium]